MAIDMTPDQRAQGEANFKEAQKALGLDRRTFLQAGLVGAGLGLTAGAVYFGYKSVKGNPVKAALIGCGDEGGVLVGNHNKDYLQIVAACDIRPSNMKRVFDGEPAPSPRTGLNKIYGADAKDIKQISDYDKFEEELAKNKDIEAIVIALPLHLHAPVAIRAMQIGKERGKPIHVLCEKLMAWNIKQCKQMIQVAKETGSILSIGHQRHYSVLYDHAMEVIRSGTLGDIKHIRALWHRNITWPYKHDPKKGTLVKGVDQPAIRDGWFPPVMELDYDALKGQIGNIKCFDSPQYASVEQLIRWRLHAETGGGLMAELGSHQLDACSIFLGKVKPVSVQGTGAKLFFGPGKNDRNIDDHVFATYTFPGKDYYERDDKGHLKLDGNRRPIIKKKDDLVVMTYSSISTNSFEAYGECLMGSRGTMVVEAESKIMLYTEKAPGKKGDQRMMDVKVQAKKPGDAVEDSSSTWSAPVAQGGGKAAAGPAGPISRGYREEMEDFAYCVRLLEGKKFDYSAKKDGKYVGRLPRCHGEIAMADAIVALAANAAMARGEKIVFEPQWFDSDLTALPKWDGKEKIDCKVELKERKG